MAALHADEHLAVRIAYADISGFATVFLLRDIVIAVLPARDIIRAAHAGPHAEEVAVGREYLDALVRPIGHVELALGVDRDAVRQMELALGVARRAPRRDEPAVAREAVDAGVAVAVGHVNVAVGVGDHVGGVIERASRANREPGGPGAARVR